MTSVERFRVIRRWRAVIAAGVLMGVVVGWLSAPGRAERAVFEAAHTMIVDPQASPDARLYQATVLVQFGPVPDRVAARMGIDRRLLRAMVSARMRDDLNELVIIGRSPDPRQAEAVADVTAEELVVELGGPKAPLHTLEPAVAAPLESDDITAPSSRPTRALFLGGFGLFLGLGAAVMLERFDQRIRSKHTAEEALGMAVVAEVPPIPRSDRTRLLTGTESSAVIEAFRRLRAFVTASAPDTETADGHRVIVVTSATPEEGKTATVAHLAATLAEVGRTVLVVSADLRRPRLHLYFDRPREPGLTDMLRGAPDVRRLTDLNMATAIRGIRFVASGAPMHNTAPLIEQAGDVLATVRTMADFVLVDSPALLETSDAAELAVHADEVLLVVRAGRTPVKAARRSAELLERLRIPVLGVVIVDSDRKSSEWSLPVVRNRRRWP